jgi:hypothetical protein
VQPKFFRTHRSRPVLLFPPRCPAFVVGLFYYELDRKEDA